MSKKYFINNLNTAFGQALLSELVKQPTEDPVHMCTMKDNINDKPNGIKKILKRQKPKLFAKKATQQCQVYVYNIDQTDTQDIQFGIQMMKKPFQDNKTFILVSDIMVWSNTQRKIKKDPAPPITQQNAQQGGQPQPQQQQPNKPQQQQNKSQSQQNNQRKQDLQQQQDAIQQKQIVYTFLEDIDYQSRNPLAKYQYIKDIQDKVLGFKRENVKVFVVCPGIIYGCGENTFYPLFKAAWLQEPGKLPYLGDGENLIPTVHLKDLVKFVIKLAQGPPEESSPYLLAFDLNKQKAQKSLITAISQGIGSGDVISVENSALLQNQQKFKLNLDIKASKFFIGTDQQPAQFQWTAKTGIKDNIKSLLKDFCEKQALRPIKMIIFQKQKQWTKQSKINFILDTFSKYYRVPVLTVHKILQYARQYAQKDLLQDLNEEWQNIMAYLKQNQQRSGLDQTMKVFYRVIRWRLLRNDCSNRGFILHNFPSFRPELEMIFNKISLRKFKRKVPKKKKQLSVVVATTSNKIPAEGDEQNQNGQQKNEQNPSPSTQQIPPAQQQPQQPQPQQQQPAEQQGEQQSTGPKVQIYYPQTLISVKRMGTQLEDTIPLVEYFISNGIEELVYDTTSKAQNQIFQSLRTHVQRNGRPNNYLVNQNELIRTYQQHIQKENEKNMNAREKRTKNDQQSKKAIQTKRLNLARQIIQLVQNQGEQQIKKMPFRNYLMEFVVPTLNQGLLQVSNIIPNDPVDLLAQYLYQKSYDV